MLSTGGGGGCRSINWDFIIANNHSKLLCIDIYAEANRPFLHTLFRVHITHAENYKRVQAHTYASARASANRALPRVGRGQVGGGGEGSAILVIAFWLLFTRRVHTVFASTGLTNVYRQKLTGNLFGRIVDGNYYFIDGHARTTDLLLPPLIIYWPVFRFANAPNAIIARAPTALCSFVH